MTAGPNSAPDPGPFPDDNAGFDPTMQPVPGGPRDPRDPPDTTIFMPPDDPNAFQPLPEYIAPASEATLRGLGRLSVSEELKVNETVARSITPMVEQGISARAAGKTEFAAKIVESHLTRQQDIQAELASHGRSGRRRAAALAARTPDIHQTLVESPNSSFMDAHSQITGRPASAIPETTEQAIAWEAVVDPRNVRELRRAMIEAGQLLGVDNVSPRKSASMTANEGIYRFVPQVVSAYFGVTEKQYKDQLAGGQIVVPPEVLEQTAFLMRLGNDKGLGSPDRKPDALDMHVPTNAAPVDNAPARRANEWITEHKRRAAELAQDLAAGPARLTTYLDQRDQRKGITTPRAERVERMLTDAKYMQFFAGSRGGIHPALLTPGGKDQSWFWGQEYRDKKAREAAEFARAQQQTSQNPGGNVQSNAPDSKKGASSNDPAEVAMRYLLGQYNEGDEKDQPIQYTSPAHLADVYAEQFGLIEQIAKQMRADPSNAYDDEDELLDAAYNEAMKMAAPKAAQIFDFLQKNGVIDDKPPTGADSQTPYRRVRDRPEDIQKALDDITGKKHSKQRRT